MKRVTVLCLAILLNGYARSQYFLPSFNNSKQKIVAPKDPYAHGRLLTDIKADSTSSFDGDGIFMHTIPITKGISLFPDSKSRTKKSPQNKTLSKIYAKLYSGFGIFTPGSFRVNSSYPQHDTTVKIETKKGLGNGLRIGGGFGLVMNDFLNAGMDAEYHKVSWTENFLNVHTDDQNYNEKSSGMNYKIVSLTPYVIFKALAKPKYYVYNKLGILLTLPFTLGTSEESKYAISEKVQNDLNFFENVNSVTSENYKISLGVGLNVALGINMRLSEKFRAFGEVFGNYSALSPKSSVKVSSNKTSASFTSDNSDPILIKQASRVTTNTTYEKGGSLPVNPIYTIKPPVNIQDYIVTDIEISTVAHQFTINMAALGINAGIIYRF